MTANPTDPRDIWARWLLERRHGGSAAARRAMLAFLEPVRDRVLDAAMIQPGERVLDVGCGEGLLGFGALPRVGAGGAVIFSDVSTQLLDVCRRIAAPAGLVDRCEFVHDGLPELGAFADVSVDVAMTRSVLIYVRDKAAAFHSLYRVLRPGGRISLFEPINRYRQAQAPYAFFGYEAPEHLVAKLMPSFADADSTLLDFDERDLLRFAEAAGFTQIKLDLVVELDVPEEHAPRDWTAFLNSAPNPTAPTFGEAMDAKLDPTERAAFERAVRPLVEAGRATRRLAVAYLRAVRP